MECDRLCLEESHNARIGITFFKNKIQIGFVLKESLLSGFSILKIFKAHNRSRPC